MKAYCTLNGKHHQILFIRLLQRHHFGKVSPLHPWAGTVRTGVTKQGPVPGQWQDRNLETNHLDRVQPDATLTSNTGHVYKHKKIHNWNTHLYFNGNILTFKSESANIYKEEAAWFSRMAAAAEAVTTINESSFMLFIMMDPSISIIPTICLHTLSRQCLVLRTCRECCGSNGAVVCSTQLHLLLFKP